jgi:hypothetical protein
MFSQFLIHRCAYNYPIITTKINKAQSWTFKLFSKEFDNNFLEVNKSDLPQWENLMKWANWHTKMRFFFYFVVAGFLSFALSLFLRLHWVQSLNFNVSEKHENFLIKNTETFKSLKDVWLLEVHTSSLKFLTLWW